ncbi:Ubiquitin carboxyl-terminal hydrolase 2 [Bienertia sinuspersici]
MASHQSIGSGSSSKSGKIKFNGSASPLLPQSNCSFEDSEVRWSNQRKALLWLFLLAGINEMEELKQKVKRLKEKKEKLQDEVGEMGIATTETLFEMKENNTDKKLMLTLVFSWAFFTLVLLMK